MLSRKTLLLTTTVFTFALADYRALAQEVKLEEIVVTARKREENVLEVPMAITALTAKDIEQRGIKDAIELAEFTPGFFTQAQGGFGDGENSRLTHNFIFRGLNVANNTGSNAGGKMFLDGAPVNSGDLGGLTDIERVEVLKGPQSAYFGRSTFAGAINYVTKDPSNTFQGKINAEYSSYDSTDDSLSLEGPIVDDKLAARIGVRYYRKGGEYTNAGDTNERLGNQSTKSVALTLVATPSDALKIKAFGNFFMDDDGAPATAALEPNQTYCNPGAAPYFCGVVPHIDPKYISAYDVITPFVKQQLFDNVNNLYSPYDTHYLEHAGLKRKAAQADLIATYDYNDYTLSSITAYHFDRTSTLEDFDFRDNSGIPNPYYGLIPTATPFTWWLFLIPAEGWDWSQEIRITSPSDQRFRWTGGFNYGASTNLPTPVLGISNYGTTNYGLGGRNESYTPAVFGALYYDIMPKLTLSGEARYQWDKIEEQAPGPGPYTYANTQFNIPLAATFRSFSPRVTLDYKFAPDSTAYALWSRGYRPGGFNGSIVSQPQSVIDELRTTQGVNLAYLQERLDNFEIGVKSRFWDGRATSTIAVYYGKLTNQQDSQFKIVPVAGPNGTTTIDGFSVTTNIGKTDIDGVEWQGDLQLTKQLRLSGTFALNNTDIRVYSCGQCASDITGSFNVTGNQLRNVPKYTGSASAEYTDHLVADYKWYARIDYIYRGTQYAEEANVAQTGAANYINLHAGVRTDRIQIEGFVNNLTDNKTYLGIQAGTDVVTFSDQQMRLALPDKLTMGVRVSYQF